MLLALHWMVARGRYREVGESNIDAFGIDRSTLGPDDDEHHETSRAIQIGQEGTDAVWRRPP